MLLNLDDCDVSELVHQHRMLLPGCGRREGGTEIDVSVAKWDGWMAMRLAMAGPSVNGFRSRDLDRLYTHLSPAEIDAGHRDSVAGG